MHYGIDMVTFGPYADPRNVVEIAQAAEAAGWDGLFVWDHLAFTWGVPSGDPWVILAAVAGTTERIKIGTAVTPVPRHRPHVLANILATLDLLSDGRLIFGAGLGATPEEFSNFGESGDAKVRAVMLDEGLEVIDRLMSGESVTHQGAYYRVENTTLSPLPVQRPRVPIWVGGESPPALRRAAQWDGWVIGGDNMEGEMVKTPAELASQITVIEAYRTAPNSSFDYAITGVSTSMDRPLARAYASSGATWWLETLAPVLGSHEDMLARVNAGPPK
jgi:alkanesulfonate monooxygenase SsuD/methylene tetrahydromethanopterin reductase-like flavin-dependent oxidoreductase (luciferase family)